MNHIHIRIVTQLVICGASCHINIISVASKLKIKILKNSQGLKTHQYCCEIKIVA